jgi:hypothetical protein
MSYGIAPIFGDHGNDMIVANALIWAALIVAVTSALQGTEYASQLLPILIGGAGGSVLLLVAWVRRFRNETDC